MGVERIPTKAMEGLPRAVLFAVLVLATSVVLPAITAPSAVAASQASAANTGGVSLGPTPSRRPVARRPAVRQRAVPASSGGASYRRQLVRAPTPAPVRPRAPRTPDVRPPPSSKSPTLHDFPVAGPYSYGGADARFGAPRSGHVHQGQDILAAAGTPVVAPHGGTISWRANQPNGAGFYVVLDSLEGPLNYVFMHLMRGSILVRVGDRVRTGQQLGSVGRTGEASTPHLHFEVWQGPWYAGGHPIDPLPLLKAWATAR
jgi:murein DD-endopeptidase MepM/ murein hydrolase activator NlpD